MDISGKFFIDGIDMFLTWKIGIEKASEELLKFPAKKEGIVHDWLDANGKDYDLSNIFLDERNSTLDLWVITADEAEFWTSRNSFITQLTKPGLHRLTLANHGMRDYYFFYKSTPSWKDLVKLKDGTGRVIAHKFQISICEPEPAIDDEIATALSDEDGRVIIT